jgi:nucleoside 2-deoxyribosyltransferase
VEVNLKAYLAGPDVFLPNAVEHARRKVVICAKYGIVGCSPLNEDIETLSTMANQDAWRAIFAKDLAMMEECDIIIANLTPFRGASADAGTLIEVGWFLGRGKPIFGYSNSAVPFIERSRIQTEAIPDPISGLSVEGFGLLDNLMIPGAVAMGGGHPVVLPSDGRNQPFDSLEVFKTCVDAAARALGIRAG